MTETPNQAGKHWTWVHWELPVDTSQFFTATEVVCRAWDESQNTQPAVLTWTLLGQGNNSMFRLRLHKEVDPQVGPCSLTLLAPHSKYLTINFLSACMTLGQLHGSAAVPCSDRCTVPVLCRPAASCGRLLRVLHAPPSCFM